MSRRDRELGSYDFSSGNQTPTLATQAGVFSRDSVDAGTVCLLEAALPRVKPHMTVLDLGAGAGVIGLAVAAKLTRGEVWMVDSDIRALRLIERNIAQNQVSNAHAVLGDITLDLPPKLKFDLVLSNPPTHSGKDVLRAFIDESYAVLRPGGALYIVINRLLSAAEMMKEAFGASEQVARCRGFLVLRSEKPRPFRG